MAKVIKAGILGGIVVYIWSAISWMVLPWHMTTIHAFSDEQAISQAVTTQVSQSGIYLLPSMKKGAETQPAAQMPMVFAAVHVEGMPGSMTRAIIISIMTQIIAALLVAWLLSRTTILSYGGRVLFVVIFALAAGIVTDVPYWTWFGFDTSYILVAIADLLIGWFFAGLVLAKICK